jgi:hypothetical protein
MWLTRHWQVAIGVVRFETKRVETKRNKKKSLSAKLTRPLPRPRRLFVLGCLLAVTTVALYYPTIHHPFANYDDDGYVSENAHLKTGLSWNTIQWAFGTYYQANWHPVTWLSHGLDVQLFQFDPAGHHATNILLHLINVVLLFWVLLRATRSAGPSFMVAALCALHPINVESVVWVTERKNLLSMLFFLLTLGAYHWYAREPRISRYIVVALLFVLGLLAKPQVITLPFVLLLWDFWPLRRTPTNHEQTSSAEGAYPARTWRQLLLEKLPLLVMAAISAVVTMIAQRIGGGINPTVSLAARLANAVVSYARYLGKLFWPLRLAPMYPHPGSSLPRWEILGTSCLLLAVTALVVAGRRHRYLPVGWFWFLGTLIPMIGFVQVGRQAMADRYAYLPFIGLYIVICWGVAEAAEQRRVPAGWLVGGSAVVLLALAGIAHRQIDFWSDNVVLWSHTLQVTTFNYEAEANLGEALLAKGEGEEALAHFHRALEIDSSLSPPYMYLGVYDQQHGKLQQAIEEYRRAITATEYTGTNLKAQAFANMGHAYLQLGDVAPARESLQTAVNLNPDKVEPWLDLGLVKQKSGDLPGAIQAYSAAMKIKANDVGLLLLARAFEDSGQNQEAQSTTQRARRLSRNFDAAQRLVDRLLSRQGSQ